MKLIILNFVLFQIGWLACVMGGANGIPWLGLIAVALIVAVHLVNAEDPVPEAILLSIATVIGVIWESLLAINSLMLYQTGLFIDGLAPYWLIALWPLFATTMNVSMRWLKNRFITSAVFGAIGGPAAFFAGHHLGAVDFPDMLQSMLVLGLGWGILMPVMVYLAGQFDGYQKREVQLA